MKRCGPFRVCHGANIWCNWTRQATVFTFCRYRLTVKFLSQRRPAEHRSTSSRGEVYSSLAGTENGWLASTTNMMSAVRSVVPLLNTCIAIPPSCPFMVSPALTRITPCGVR